MDSIRMLLLLLLTASLLFNCVNSSTNGNRVEQILEDRLSSSKYNSRVRPGADSGDPLDVDLSVNINAISSISEVNMEYSLTMYLRQSWADHRLAYNDTGYDRSITLNYNQFDRVWTPDVFIRNLKSGSLHTLTVPNRLIRLAPDGTVFFSQRLGVTLACDMDLDRFPMDNQTCKIEIGSYAYSVADLVFKWRTSAVAVEVNPGINLPEYTIAGINNESCTQSTPGAFPCLRANFKFTRRLKAYVLTSYLPSFLVVLLSWLSFWIDPDSTPARTSLSILTILTITTQSSALMRSMPSGSVTKAIDVWMATCLVFVFGAFIEYSIVNTLSRKKKKNQKKAEAGDEKANDSNGQVGSGSDGFCSSGRSWFWSLFNWKDDPGMTVEIASRILFPLVFFIFCLVYWPFYLLASD